MVALEFSRGTCIFLLEEAFIEALSGSDLEIFQMRFGLSYQGNRESEFIGAKFGLSKYDIGLTIHLGLKRIVWRSKSDLIKNDSTCCLRLITFLRDVIGPNELHHIKNLVDFCEEELSHLLIGAQAIPLVASLIYDEEMVDYVIQKASKEWNYRYWEWCETPEDSILKGRLKKTFQNLKSYIVWSDFECNEIHPVPTVASRGVNFEFDRAGSFTSHKLGREVEFESHNELRFFSQLENCDEVLTYQEQPFKIPLASKVKAGIYHPDIVVKLNDQRIFMVEVKPCYQMNEEENCLKWKALKKFCRERGWGALMTDSSRALQEVELVKSRFYM